MKSDTAYELIKISLDDVRALCVKYHGYGSAGGQAVYCFGVVEEGRIVAAYSWQPPAPGAAKAVCPEAPQGVLALSRMVAVPREERKLNHVSRPLRRQMNREYIDRTRWPVLITYSDEGQGHTGHVYRCSGWEATVRNKRPVYEDAGGNRASCYSNGRHGSREDVVRAGSTVVQRWEHWACARGQAAEHMAQGGWERVAVVGKVWRSGNQVYTYRKAT